jgi:hypothetical protein
MERAHTNCPHAFEDADRSPFVETRAARSCRLCQRVEVLFRDEWTELEEYVQHRRDERRAAE